MRPRSPLAISVDERNLILNFRGFPVRLLAVRARVRFSGVGDLYSRATFTCALCFGGCKTRINGTPPWTNLLNQRDYFFTHSVHSTRRSSTSITVRYSWTGCTSSHEKPSLLGRILICHQNCLCQLHLGWYALGACEPLHTVLHLAVYGATLVKLTPAPPALATYKTPLANFSLNTSQPDKCQPCTRPKLAVDLI